MGRQVSSKDRPALFLIGSEHETYSFHSTLNQYSSSHTQMERRPAKKDWKSVEHDRDMFFAACEEIMMDQTSSAERKKLLDEVREFLSKPNPDHVACPKRYEIASCAIPYDEKIFKAFLDVEDCRRPWAIERLMRAKFGPEKVRKCLVTSSYPDREDFDSDYNIYSDKRPRSTWRLSDMCHKDAEIVSGRIFPHVEDEGGLT